MATVITSLASALPLVGQPIVNWLWGGFAVIYLAAFLTEEKILLYAGNTSMSTTNLIEIVPIIDFSDVHGYIPQILLARSVKGSVTLMAGIVKWAWGQSAGVHFIRKSSAAPQRLNAKEQAWLVGLYEADGWFAVNKNGKYVQYEFGLEMHIRDKSLLHKIKDMLKIDGIVKVRKDRPSKVVLKVRNKVHLKSIIVPIFEKFPMLTKKRWQFEWFKKHLILMNTIYYIDTINDILPTHTPFTNVKEVLNCGYFDAWLVGFMTGEACFSVYKATKETNYTLSFDIGQTNSYQIISAIRRRLKLRAKPFIDNKNHWKIKTTSVDGIRNVVRFIHRTPVQLGGYKHVQYVLWIKALRINPRYALVKVPTKL